MWQPHNLTLPVPSFIEIVSRGSAPTAAPMASFSHCPALPPVQCLLLLPRWPPSPIVPPSHRFSARCCRPDGLLLPLSRPPTGSMPAAAAPMASFSHCPALPPAQCPLLPPRWPPPPTVPPSHRFNARCCCPDGLLLPLPRPPTGSAPAAAPLPPPHPSTSSAPAGSASRPHPVPAERHPRPSGSAGSERQRVSAEG